MQSGKLRNAALQRRAAIVLAVMASVATPAGGALARSPSQTTVLAEQILEASGIQGGLVVHLGCGDGKLTAALRAGDSFLVHGLDADADRATGILYREGLPASIDRPGWRTILNQLDPIARMQVPLYGALVASLAAALTRAACTHRAEPHVYGRMLANLFSKAGSFTWEEAARKYGQLYDLAAADAR